MKRILLEVAVESLEDALAAADAGADRLELCSDLNRGGLTPYPELYAAVRRSVLIPLAVMIRPEAGESFTVERVLPTMLRQIAAFRLDPPAAFVFGALHSDGSIDSLSCQRLLGECGDVPAVFHRAWDVAPRTLDDLEALIAMGFRRLLTSGCQPTAEAGSAAIRGYVEQARGRLVILPGSGVGPGNSIDILRAAGCEQLHGTFRVPSAGPRVRVDAMRVREMRILLDQLSADS